MHDKGLKWSFFLKYERNARKTTMPIRCVPCECVCLFHGDINYTTLDINVLLQKDIFLFSDMVFLPSNSNKYSWSPGVTRALRALKHWNSIWSKRMKKRYLQLLNFEHTHSSLFIFTLWHLSLRSLIRVVGVPYGKKPENDIYFKSFFLIKTHALVVVSRRLTIFFLSFLCTSHWNLWSFLTKVFWSLL